MNIDKALMIADDAASLPASGVVLACVVLAAEVRRQHAELQTAKNALFNQSEVTEKALVEMNRNADLGQSAEAEVARLRGLCRTCIGMLRDAGADADATTIEGLVYGDIGPDDLFAEHG